MIVVLVVVAVLVGGGAGGALIAANILGSDDAADLPVASFPTPPSSRLSEAASVQPSQDQPATDATGGPEGFDFEALAGLRDRLASGDVTEEELAQLRQQFQDFGGFGGGEGFQGRGGGGFGAIESIDGATVTLATAQGALSAAIDDETVIRITSEGGVERLELGMQVSVFAERDTSGVLTASAITVVPEGEDGFGGFGGAGQLGERFSQFQGRGGLGGGRRPDGGGFDVDRALTGTIESIDGGELSVETAQGPLVVVVGPDTVVRLTVQGGIADLEVGMNVAIGGQPVDDGPMAATTITVVPEGADGQFGFGGGAFQGGGR